MNHLAEIQALLYLGGENGLAAHEISELLVLEKTAVFQLLDKLIKQLNENEDSGLTIIKTEDRYKLVTKKQYADLMNAYFEAPDASHLSQAALEVLAIIVYKQPVTRIEIDEIRGVQSSGAIQTLVLRQLVEEKGRKEAPGRPILYGTSAFFLDYFGLNSIDDLPNLTTFQLSLDETDADISSADLYYRRFEETIQNQEDK